jgi:uncharacterized protein (TIGR03118 family)
MVLGLKFLVRTMTMKAKLSFLAAQLGVVGLSASHAARAQQPSDKSSLLEYTQHNLVSDEPGLATTTDPTLVDPWGLAFQPTGAFWVGDQGKGVATLYDGIGTKVNATFVIPKGSQSSGVAGPTGVVANPTRTFNVPGTSLSSFFVFATLDGTISAWAPNLPTNPTFAVLAVDNSASHAVYTGVDIGINAKGAFLFAANLAAGRIDVFDNRFAPASGRLTGSFADPAIPTGYAPFNVRNVLGNLYVTYAKRNATKTFVETGAGEGFVDEFDTDGNLLSRIASGGALNAPWGVAQAPDGFGLLSGGVLIGNFGDGHIFGFGANLLNLGPKISFVPLLDANEQPFAVPGLWSLDFGGGANSTPDTLFFTAGIDGGQHGLFGSLTAVVPTP